MITKRVFLLRGSCFCDKFSMLESKYLKIYFQPTEFCYHQTYHNQQNSAITRLITTNRILLSPDLSQPTEFCYHQTYHNQQNSAITRLITTNRILLSPDLSQPTEFCYHQTYHNQVLSYF